ncbi:MAG: hypothetical protein ACRDZ8_16150 [Acidimicrobiales bacterium]
MSWRPRPVPPVAPVAQGERVGRLPLPESPAVIVGVDAVTIGRTGRVFTLEGGDPFGCPLRGSPEAVTIGMGPVSAVCQLAPRAAPSRFQMTGIWVDSPGAWGSGRGWRASLRRCRASWRPGDVSKIATGTAKTMSAVET